MRCVKKSSIVLHTRNLETKADKWDGLILAAEGELQRIRQRSGQLKEAIKVFRKRKSAGDPFVQSASQSGVEATRS